VAGGPVLANLQSIKMKREVISNSRRRILGVLLLFLKTIPCIQHTEDKYSLKYDVYMSYSC